MLQHYAHDMNKSRKTRKVPTALDLLSALGEHVEQLRPSVNENPGKKKVSAARTTAAVVNSAMTVVRTSVYASKTLGTNTLPFLSLSNTIVPAKA